MCDLHLQSESRAAQVKEWAKVGGSPEASGDDC